MRKPQPKTYRDSGLTPLCHRHETNARIAHLIQNETGGEKLIDA